MSDRRFTLFSKDGAAPKNALPGGMYLAGSESGSFGGGEEVQRAIDISVMGAAGAGAATFLPPSGGDEKDLAVSWESWLDERFAKVLGPAFCRVHAAVGEMRIGGPAGGQRYR